MELTVLQDPPSRRRRLPPWLKRPLPFGDFSKTKAIVADSGVATVCEDARCPNLSECWSKGTATFMIMGHDCTRRCHYCAVNTAKPEPLELDEPQRLADAVQKMQLRHVVITAVARDDLPDDGASHFAACIKHIRSQSPDVTIEVLPADLNGRVERIATIVRARPDIFNHNIETVERLHPSIRPQARYERSISVLEIVKQIDDTLPTKSGIMVGLGETTEELIDVFRDLHAVGCDILTIGQYLSPGEHHAAVEKFYTPSEFDELATAAREIGFRYVASGPFVRSSYNAGDVFQNLIG